MSNETESPAPPPKKTGNRTALIVFVVIALIGGGLWFTRKKDAAAGGPPGAAGGKGPGGDRKVPVLVDTVVQRDQPIVLEGLGTVTSLSTVQVKSQVDGRLVNVTFKEGALVKKGELLAQIDPRPFQILVAQTTSTLARDEAQLKNAELVLERNQKLKEQNLVAQQVVDDAQTAVDQLKATRGIDQAAADNARLQLEYSRIISPIDGVAGLRQVDPGNLVRAADTSGLVVLAQLDPISVVFTLPQDELDRLQRAMTAGNLQVEAWARDGRTLLGTGTLSVIDNQVNATTGTVKLRAQFANPTRALWPNQFVKARLAVDQKKGALVIAAAAIQRGPQGTFVYLASADNTAKLQNVEVDLIEGSFAVIRSGLQAGDRVITDGQSQLKPGSPIEARTAGPVAQAKDAP
ncbi:MAG: efflux RND transporter periplasmic adaptor subunit [Archangium sp.]